MYRRHLLSIGMAVLLVSLSVSSVSAADGSQAVDAEWLKAMKANDLNAIVACYASDAIAWLPEEPQAKGTTDIKATYQSLLADNTVKEASLTNTKYYTVGKRSIGWGNYSLTLAPKAGGNPVVLTGRFTDVAELRGNRWVYILDHASADPKPSAGQKP